MRVGDEGTIVYGAQRVAEGAVPFRDFLEVMGPACFYWLGLFFKLFGISFEVARNHLWLTAVLTTLLAYHITRFFIRGPLQYLPPLAVCALGIPLWPASSHHWDSNLFFLSALAAYLHALEKRRRGLFLMAGAIGAVTALFMIQKGAFLLIALSVVTAVSMGARRARLSGMAALIAGATVVFSLTACWFLFQHSLQQYVYANIVWPSANYHSVNKIPFNFLFPTVAAASWNSVFADTPSAAWSSIALTSGWLLIPLLPMIGVVLILVRSTSGLSQGSLFEAQSLAVGLSGGALWISEVHRPDFFHLAYAAPVLLIYCCYLLGDLLRPSRTQSVVAVACAALIMIPALARFANATRVLKTGSTVATRRGVVVMPSEDEALDFLLKSTEQRAKVFIYPYYPMYYFLADVQNPTRFSIMLYGNNTSGQFADSISALERQKVEWVLSDTVVSGANFVQWFPGYHHPAPEKLIMERYLAERYEYVRTASGFKILRRK